MAAFTMHMLTALVIGIVAILIGLTGYLPAFFLTTLVTAVAVNYNFFEKLHLRALKKSWIINLIYCLACVLYGMVLFANNYPLLSYVLSLVLVILIILYLKKETDRVFATINHAEPDTLWQLLEYIAIDCEQNELAHRYTIKNYATLDFMALLQKKIAHFQRFNHIRDYELTVVRGQIKINVILA